VKVAVIGATGQLGVDLCGEFLAAGHEVVALDHGEVEISAFDSVKSRLELIHPDLVINTAAFHHVEKCEAEPAVAFAVNGAGARNVALAAETLGAKLIHVSTDYVFDGEKRTPYLETDLARPVNVYGNTKLSGEHFARCMNSRCFVVRVSGLYGSHPCRAKGGLNFVELMLKLSREREVLRVVDDEFVTPTATSEIARQLLVLGQTSAYGLYHCTAEGSCSWYEFAGAIFELMGTKISLQRARPGEFPAKVPRPKYSVLENAALKSKSLNIFADWRVALEKYLKINANGGASQAQPA
jgi:dTDP-4-dehydrorhamnose reductase